MKKKAQSATEFLSTYGLALLIIAIGVGAAFYLTSNRSTLPTQCTFTDPFACNDLKVGEEEIILDITASGIQETTSVPTFTLEGTQYPCDSNINKGRTELTCTSGSPIGEQGDLFSGTVRIVYTLEGGSIEHESVYTISGTVEK
jgi:hypothetical protein